MPDVQEQRKKILAACSSGDISALKTLFHECGIGPDQPLKEWGFDKTLPQHQRTPSVNWMLQTAVEGQQIDTLCFLCSTFPGATMDGGPMSTAIDTGNVDLVRTVCRLDPTAANGEVGYSNVLAYACSRPENAEIVHVLLQSGADPNKEAPHTPPFSNASYAVSGGLPASTIEHFFDAGYQCNDGWAVRWAVSYQRPDILEILFARGKKLPAAWFPPQQELMADAKEKNDADMVALIQRIYPRKAKKGFLAAILRRLKI